LEKIFGKNIPKTFKTFISQMKNEKNKTMNEWEGLVELYYCDQIQYKHISCPPEVLNLELSSM
jgi:hypothetical protein